MSFGTASFGWFLSKKTRWFSLFFEEPDRSQRPLSWRLYSAGPLFMVWLNALSRLQLSLCITCLISPPLISSLLIDSNDQFDRPLRCLLIASQQKDLPDPGVAKGIMKVTFFLVIDWVATSGSSVFDFCVEVTRLTELWIGSLVSSKVPDDWFDKTFLTWGTALPFC